MVRDADGGQDDVILRPLKERPLAVGRLRGSPLGGPVVVLGAWCLVLDAGCGVGQLGFGLAAVAAAEFLVPFR